MMTISLSENAIGIHERGDVCQSPPGDVAGVRLQHIFDQNLSQNFQNRLDSRGLGDPVFSDNVNNSVII